MVDGADQLLGPGEPEPSWAGDVTWRLTDSLRAALFGKLSALRTRDLHLDVRAVTSIDTAGIGVLVGANHRAAATGHRLVLIDSNGPVTAALSRLHLLGLFHITQVIPDRDPRAVVS